MIKIIEFEDFAKYVAMQEWAFIREQLEDGEENIIDPITKNHKAFVVFWNQVGDFRHEHKLPYIIYDPKGNEINEHQYYNILSEILEKYGSKGKNISDYFYLGDDKHE